MAILRWLEKLPWRPATSRAQLALHEEIIGELRATREQLATLERDTLRHQIAIKWDLIHRLSALEVPPAALACALCGHTAPRETFAVYESHCAFEGGPLLRHQCPACDVIFGTEAMLALSEDELSREYEWHYRVFTEGDSTEAELRAFDALQPRRDGVYLNWGAGAWSSTIPRLRAEGWNVFGYEPHASATAPSPGLLTSRRDLEALRFDGIFSNNLLEHLRHPAETLRGMASLLGPGGLMAHATPCFEYRFEFTRFHLFFFLGRSREWLAGAAGLAIESYEADGDFINLVLRPR
jgi:SAM-dependent methyltransferase